MHNAKVSYLFNGSRELQGRWPALTKYREKQGVPS